jgi:hypothetical protein
MGRGYRKRQKQKISALRGRAASTNKKPTTASDILAMHSLTITNQLGENIFKVQNDLGRGVVKIDTPERLMHEFNYLAATADLPETPKAQLLANNMLWTQECRGQSVMSTKNYSLDISAQVGRFLHRAHQINPNHTNHPLVARDRYPSLVQVTEDKKLPPQAQLVAEDALQTINTLPALPVLVHGDLHTGNCLIGKSQISIIDPLPGEGAAGMDLACWAIHNPENPNLHLSEALANYGSTPDHVREWYRFFGAVQIYLNKESDESWERFREVCSFEIKDCEAA